MVFGRLYDILHSVRLGQCNNQSVDAFFCCLVLLFVISTADSTSALIFSLTCASTSASIFPVPSCSLPHQFFPVPVFYFRINLIFHQFSQCITHSFYLLKLLFVGPHDQFHDGAIQCICLIF